MLHKIKTTTYFKNAFPKVMSRFRTNTPILLDKVIGISDTQTALIVGFVLPFDRILDMARTVVNITGDATVSILVAKSEDDIDEEVFRSESVI